MDREWRVSREEYTSWKTRYNKVGHPSEEWAKFSMTPHPLKEVMCRVIYSTYSKNKYGRNENPNQDSHIVCFSYICKFQNINEDFIDDMLYVISGLFDFAWDDKGRDFVINLLRKGEGHNCYYDLATVVKGWGDFSEEFRLSCLKTIEQAQKKRREMIQRVEKQAIIQIQNKSQRGRRLQKMEHEVFLQACDSSKYSEKFTTESNPKLEIKSIKDGEEELEKQIALSLEKLAEEINNRNEIVITVDERLDWLEIFKRNLSHEWKKSREFLKKEYSYGVYDM